MIERAESSTLLSAPSAASIHAAMFGLLALLVAGVFFVGDHELSKAGQSAGEEELHVENFVDVNEGGSSLRQVAFLSFAAVGMLGILAPRGKAWQPQWLLVGLAALTALWCLASVLWSVDPSQSARRLAVVLCTLVGAAGLARQLSPEALCRLVVVSGMALVLLSLMLDVAAGGRPWTADYRFGGTLHPNSMASYCAIVLLASYCLATAGGRSAIYWAITFAAGGLLLLTGSRSALAALAAAWLIVWWLGRSKPNRYLSFALLACLGGGLLLAWGTLSNGSRTAVSEALLLGRSEGVHSLAGRMPLWHELADYAQDHLVAGHGFESFWSTDRIEEISESQEWAVHSAHSIYLEMVLGIGVVGAVLAVLVVLGGVRRAHCCYEATRRPAYAFALGALLFGLANGAMESTFVRPSFPAVMALCGLLMVLLFACDEQRAAAQPAQSMQRDGRQPC